MAFKILLLNKLSFSAFRLPIIRAQIYCQLIFDWMDIRT